MLGDLSVSDQRFSPVLSSHRFNPHRPPGYSFMHDVKGHDHRSQEFIVKFPLINDVSCNGTCSCDELSILSVSLCDDRQILIGWMGRFPFTVHSANCLCVTQNAFGGLRHQRRCLQYFFDGWALGVWDTHLYTILLSRKVGVFFFFCYNHFKKKINWRLNGWYKP